MILITGGAGYIGSHTALNFMKNGYEVLIFDNSIGKIELIAEKLFDSEMKIIDIEKYNLLKAHTYERI